MNIRQFRFLTDENIDEALVAFLRQKISEHIAEKGELSVGRGVIPEVMKGCHLDPFLGCHPLMTSGMTPQKRGENRVPEVLSGKRNTFHTKSFLNSIEIPRFVGLLISKSLPKSGILTYL